MWSYRRLNVNDFEEVVRISKPFREDDKLKYDRKIARENFRRLCTDRRYFVLGAYWGDRMVGAIGVTSDHNIYAQKQYAQLCFWFGPLELMDRAIAWVADRPAIRMFGVAFDRPVRPGIYKFLERRGFERSGDMNILWRGSNGPVL